MARRFGGVMGPLVTPFKADESLDIAGFETNVRAHMAAGLEGVLVAGSTGEAALLGDDERRILLDAARRIVPTDRTLLAVLVPSPRATASRVAATPHSSGADAVLVVAPHYYTSSMTPAPRSRRTSSGLRMKARCRCCCTTFRSTCTSARARAHRRIGQAREHPWHEGLRGRHDFLRALCRVAE
jgi:hypothetical protein